MRRFITLSFLLTLPILFLKAQTVNDTAQTPYWIDMMQDPTINFYKTQRAFEVYWQNRKIEKGCGYKPFKRWEHNMLEIIDSNGNIPKPGSLEEEVERYIRQRNKPTSSTGSSMGIVGGGTATCQTTGDWEELGPVSMPDNRTGQPNGLGRINAVAFHPNDTNIIYVGAPAGGLWRTTNGGKMWRTNTDTLATLGVSSIAIDQQHPDTIYLGTGDRDASDSYGRGVFKSTDGGMTWNLSNAGMGNVTVGRLLIDPNNSNTLVASTSSGIYRSTNGGSSWSRRQSGNFKDLTFDAKNSQYLYACGPSASFYKSTNNGSSWSKITSGLPTGKSRMGVAVTPDDSNLVYVVVTNQRSFAGLYLSTNRGTSFSLMSDTPNIMDYSHLGTGTGGQAWYDLDISVDPKNKAVVNVCGVNIFQSLDSGKTWKINAHWVGSGGSPKVHADNHILEYQPITNTLFTGNDGGVYYTKDLGKNWTEISDGLATAQIYRLGQSQTESNTVINGYQDNGTGFYERGKWYTVVGGDGMDCVIDPTNAGWAYSALYYGDIRRIKDGRSQGTIAKNGVNSITESGGWVTPYVLREGTPSTMFVGYKNIWRSTNIQAASRTSVSWTKISNNVAGSNSNNITAIENSPADNDILYVSRTGNKFFKSTNVNATSPSWTDLTSSLPNNSSVAWIETHPTYKDRVWIVQSNKIYQSNNGGSSWSNISSGLPSITILCVAFDSSSQKQGMYAGTYMGVFYRDTTMSKWQWFNDKMPINTRVRDIEIYHSPNGRNESHVVCATYGRGNWKSSLYDEDQITPVAGFMVSNTTTCKGDSITFTDTSLNRPTEWLWRFSPNTVTFINGTDSTSQNPEIRIDSSQQYTVQLLAENCAGIDTVQKVNFIKLPNKTVPGFTADKTTICKGESITFTDTSLNDPSEWLWRFSPNYVTFMNGTDSNDKNPIVRFDSSETYSVQLFTTNCSGTDSIQKVNLIKLPTPVVTAKCTTTTTNKSVNYGIGIFGVKIHSYNYTSKGLYDEGEYIDHKCDETLKLKPDTFYIANITTGSYNDENVKIFIDFNNNGDLDDTGELVYQTKNRTNHSDTIVIPKSVPTDTFIRMRIISDFSTLGNSCNTLGYGQTEDRNIYFESNSTTATVYDTACDSYRWTLNSSTYNSSGSYTHTLSGKNAAGGDSIVTLELLINKSSSSTVRDTACDSYKWTINNTTYTNSGSYKDTLVGGNAGGCDSIITLELVIAKPNTGIDTISACNNYKWIDGKTYTSNNSTAKHTLTNAAGCDSVVTLNLTINKSTTGKDVQTACDSYKWIDSKTYTSSNTSATHTIKNSAGCDSVVTLNLTINKSSTGTDKQTACTSYKWINGTTYTSSNSSAKDTLTSSNGCDSIVTLNLTIYKPSTVTVYDTACNTYKWSQNSKTYTSSGSYKDTITAGSSNGCDSIITLSLTIHKSNTGIDKQTACNSYKWIDGKTYTSSNSSAKYTTKNSSGCDSVVTLNLTIHKSNTGTDKQTACDSYKWIDGKTYTSSNNTATHTLKNANGCDSVVTLNLTLNKSTTGTDQQTACDTYKWIDGKSYTASNSTATHTLKNAAGCDSIVTLNLTINRWTSGTDKQTACDSYKWIDGKTYTASNSTATHTLKNAAGCDSVVTLNLTINKSTTGIDKQTACNSYKWIDGKTYTASNNTATYKLKTSAGCDSIVTLNLIINKSNTGVDQQTACDSYKWIDGKTYTSDNNTATHTLMNAAGCDSVVTLNLTINKSSTGIDNQTACDTYKWIDGKTYTVSNNTATHTLTNAKGCDSVVTLNLTINRWTSGIDKITACDSMIWIDGITYTSDNNTATHTLKNANGCDSVVTLDLIVNHSATGVDKQTACDSYKWIDGKTYTVSNNTATHTLKTSTGCDSVVTLDLQIITLDATISSNDPILKSNAVGVTYQWLDCNKNYAEITGETAQEFNASQNGDYAVEVSESICIDTSDCYNVALAGLPEYSIFNQVSIYPNPSDGLVTIDLGQLQNVGLKVYNVNGKVVFENDNVQGSTFQFELDVSKGIYFIELSTKGQSQQFKLIRK